MKKVILITIGILIHTTSWCSQIPIGIDSEKLIVWEYWKFQGDKVSNNVLLYNPTNKTIRVKLKKWHWNKQNFFEKLFTRNIIFGNKTIKPNEYKILNLADRGTIKRHKGLVQFFVNKESAGIYRFKSKRKTPKNIIDKGIVINRAPNSGVELKYEIIYHQLEFNKEEELLAEVHYLENKFYRSSFHNGKDYNPFEIVVKIRECENLELSKTTASDVEIAPKEKIGNFKVVFTGFRDDRRVTQRNFSHMTNEGNGITISFNIPRKIKF